jgi:hypothetical protein
MNVFFPVLHVNNKLFPLSKCVEERFMELCCAIFFLCVNAPILASEVNFVAFQNFEALFRMDVLFFVCAPVFHSHFN